LTRELRERRRRCIALRSTTGTWRSVIDTPHASGRAESSDRRAGELFVKNLGHFIAGSPMRNEVHR